MVSLKESYTLSRKEERMRNGLFFKHLVLMCTIVLMNDLGVATCTINWRFDFHT